MRDFSNTKMPSANNDGPRLQEYVDVVNLKDGKAKTLRIVGPMTPVPIVWIPIKSKAGKKVSIPKISLQYDPETGEVDDSKKCPYIQHFGAPRASILVNVINRDKQEDAPAKLKPRTSSEKKKSEWFGYEACYKDGIDSEAWTPCEVLQIPVSAGRKIQDLVEQNKKKVKNKAGDMVVKTFGPEHAKYGFDVIIKYDKTRPPAEQYIIHKGDPSALSEEEQSYLLWRYNVERPDSLAEAEKNVIQLKKIAVSKDTLDNESADDDNDKDEIEVKRTKKAKVTSDFDDADDFDEDETPKKKKKMVEEDFDSSEEEEEEEEEKPKIKLKRKVREEEEKPKKRKSAGNSDTDDDDW